jgi:type I restriction enzyme M protein
MFEQHFRNIDDILHKDAGCTSELDYTEQSSWLLFLKYLDALDQTKADEAALESKKHSYILAPEFRWNKWAAPKTAAGNPRSYRHCCDFSTGGSLMPLQNWAGRRK